MNKSNSSRIISLDGTWLIATDPQNVGREERWWEDLPSDKRIDVKETKVPWIIQDAFPGYGGVAWLWRKFDAPANPHSEGRYLLRFWAVDYMADIWLNGNHVGGHEGAEGVFALDVTSTIKPAGEHVLAVRVLNPTSESIDGIVLGETCHYLKGDPFNPGASWNSGGIVDSVELLVTPMVRVEDLYLVPDWQTGEIEIQATIRNAGETSVTAGITFTVSPTAGGETLNTSSVEADLKPGDSLIKGSMKVNDHRLWNFNDPYRYRVTARISMKGSGSIDEKSANCGFRDFRFSDGYFRLNGKRVFLKSSHTATIYPVGLHWPHDHEVARREMIQMKMMGFNTIRFFMSLATRYQLELCDEIGLMVYAESHAGYFWHSSLMTERFDREISDMIRRDRNHPCIVIWGLLNETGHEDPLYIHAGGSLPFIRSLDSTRLVLLDSGRCGNEFAMLKDSGGTFANPGSTEWETVLDDQHLYPKVPHTAEAVRTLRTMTNDHGAVFVSEGGIGSSLDLSKLTRHYEQLGAEHTSDAQWYRAKLEQFMIDWDRWSLGDTFASPEDYFAECLARMADQRTLSLNCTRANSSCVGYSMTGTTDCADAGEGVVTLFRNLKPGTADAMYYGWYPLRWCLFAEPVQVYRGDAVRIEAVLVNEDVLKPGEYPVRVQVIGPDVARILDKSITITVPDPGTGSEPPFAIQMFSENVDIDGPSGRYRFLVTFRHGGAAAGGDTHFYVADREDIPGVESNITFWGEDEELFHWLTVQKIKIEKFKAGSRLEREVILVGNEGPVENSKWRELAERIAQGSTAIFLSPSAFAKGNQKLGWLPLVNKGSVEPLPSWLYHKDEWAKKHPIFDGLPCGGLMDYTFYREIIPEHAWIDQDLPAEVVAGAINTSLNYSAGLFTAVHEFGAGKFILNTLLIRENLGPNPVAERLLQNMLRYAARETDKPPAELPGDFPDQLEAIGYEK